uniref:Uncharacterized protein n=1 Tax=Arundo donax TaxID=35708 RepID=A0A0A8YA27_ARUDO
MQTNYLHIQSRKKNQAQTRSHEWWGADTREIHLSQSKARQGNTASCSRSALHQRRSRDRRSCRSRSSSRAVVVARAPPSAAAIAARPPPHAASVSPCAAAAATVSRSTAAATAHHGRHRSRSSSRRRSCSPFRCTTRHRATPSLELAVLLHRARPRHAFWLHREAPRPPPPSAAECSSLL